ncbi:hypothetical protein MKW92_033098 [Papaver armeniacum]|nr:hypothetical protein MKW92_033098 [Papaver armeniacum]
MELDHVYIDENLKLDATSMFDVDSLLNFDYTHAHQVTVTGHLGLEKVEDDNEFCSEVDCGVTVSEFMETVLLEETCHLKENIQEEFMDESSLTDMLLTTTEAIEAEDWLLSLTVIERLKSRLTDRQNGENSFLKLAFFFTQGLQYSINSFN